MIPVNILVQPFDLSASARTDVRAADAGSASAYGIGGVEWKPAVTARPVLSIELMSPTLDGRVQAGKCTFELSLAALGLAGTNKLKWRGAPVTVYVPTELALGTAEFSGIVVDDATDLAGQRIRLSCEVSTEFLQRPLLTAEFTGGGGATGDADKRGTLKPAGFGAVNNIEPVWFDLTNWVGMIDGYGNCTAISSLKEGLNSLGASIGNYANYAALVAASIPPGRWATCTAEGLVRLGAPPVQPITVDATFGYNRLGAIMQRILTTHAGISSSLVDSSAFNGIDVALDFAAHYWTGQQQDVKGLLERMAASINSTPLISFQGKVTITRGVTSTAVATLDRSGKQTPRVVDWRSAGTITPAWRLRARVARPARVLSFDEVNFVDDFIDRGLYSGSTVYRAGNVVWTADGSSWLYINTTAGSGNAPPTLPTTSNSYWQNLAPATTVDLGTTAVTGTLPVAKAVSGLVNANISISDTGALAGGGGGQVTIGGLGYAGDLSATNGDDLIVNASLAGNSNGWTIGGGLSWGAGGTIFPTAGLFYGATDGAFAYANKSDSSSTRIKVAGGTTYYIDFWLFSQDYTANKVKIEIEWFKPDGTTISTDSRTLAATVNNTVTRVSSFLVAPAGAALAKIVGIIVQGNVAAGNTYWGGLRIAATENSADVSANIQGPKTIDVPASSAGVPTTLPAEAGYKYYRQGVLKTPTWTVAVLTGTMTASIDANGLLSLTTSGGNFSANGTVRISAAYPGTQTKVEEITVRRVDAETSGSSGGGGGAGTTQTEAVSLTVSTSTVVVGPTLTVNCGTGGQAVLAASYDLYSSGNTAKYATTRWQRNISGTWTDVGSVHQSDTPYTRSYDPDFGYIVETGSGYHTETITGLGSNTTGHQFRLTAYVGASDGSSGTNRTVSGSSTATGS